MQRFQAVVDPLSLFQIENIQRETIYMWVSLQCLTETTSPSVRYPHVEVVPIYFCDTRIVSLQASTEILEPSFILSIAVFTVADFTVVVTCIGRFVFILHCCSILSLIHTMNEL
jgi:hypothetical protein